MGWPLFVPRIAALSVTGGSLALALPWRLMTGTGDDRPAGAADARKSEKRETGQGAEPSRSNVRRSPRYPTRHRVQGESADGQISIRGILDDLSAHGCALHLSTYIPPGTMIELICDISGIGLRLRGKVVWAKQTGSGTLQGVSLAEFPSEEDALFHRLYIGRLARKSKAR